MIKKLKKELQHLLAERYPGEANDLLQAIDREYYQMAAEKQWPTGSKNPLDKRLPVAAYLLAVIKILDAQKEKYEDIRKLILALTVRLTQPKTRLQHFIKTLAPKIITSLPVRFFLKILNQGLEKSIHSEGFSVKILTAKEETLGFGYGLDVLECGICKLYARQQYEKYTPLLCEVDYITSSMAGLQLVRQGTLANGAKKCDFRFIKTS